MIDSSAAAQLSSKRPWWQKSERIRSYRNCKYLFLLLLPAIVWYALFCYGPIYGVQLAFKDFRIMEGISGSPWVGLKHFHTMFQSANDFPRILRNTIVLSLYHIIFGFPAPIALALLFNEIRLKAFKRITQTLTYLPHFLSWVVLAGILVTILSPSTGVVNQILQWIGLEPIYFLGDKQYFRFTLVVSAIWKEIGWGTIVYLAALASVDPHLYEAAVVDGAGRWKQTLLITLPLMYPVIAIMFIFRVGGILDAGFDQVINLYHPAVYEVSDILDTYIYRVGVSGAQGFMQYGFAAAVGLYKNVIALGFVLGTNFIVKKLGQEGIM